MLKHGQNYNFGTYITVTKKATTETIIVQPIRQKRRAIELYHRDTPFRQKVVPQKDGLKQEKKHRKSYLNDLKDTDK